MKGMGQGTLYLNDGSICFNGEYSNGKEWNGEFNNGYVRGKYLIGKATIEYYYYGFES